MQGSIEIVFFISLLTLLYTYAGYPLITLLFVKIKKITATEHPAAPENLLPVTLVVAAYNEEKIIRKKILNSLSLNYPEDLLTLVFVTDGSTDATSSIVAEYSRVLHLHEPERKGKLAAMDRAVARVTTPVLIFSDANTLLNEDSIRHVVRHYSDPAVGGVAGEKRIATVRSGAVDQGEGLYWRYESVLKDLDSQLKTTVGAAGELFSLRTSLYSSLPPHTIIEDFVQSLMLCQQGYVVRYDPHAYAQEEASLSIRDEMERKVRISAGAFQAMVMLKSLFNFFRYPAVAFLFISHRVLRWTLCPLSLPALFVSSAWLGLTTGSIFYATIFGLQAIMYTMAIVGWWFAFRNKRVKAVSAPFYFAFMNFCVFAGFLRYVAGRQSPLWHKAER